MPQFTKYGRAAMLVGFTLALVGAAYAQSGSGSGSGSGAGSGSSRSGSFGPASTTQPRAANPAQPAPGNSQLSNPATGLPGTSNPQGGTSTTPSQKLAPGVPPPAATVQPSPQQQTVSPLSPQTQAPVTSGGGSAKQGQGPLALSPGSENASSAPGGGGKGLADCMGFWEPATHMTKQEWKAACQRTIGRLNR